MEEAGERENLCDPGCKYAGILPPLSVRKVSKSHSLVVSDSLACSPCSKEVLRLFPCQIKSLEVEDRQGGGGIGKPMEKGFAHHS